MVCRWRNLGQEEVVLPAVRGVEEKNREVGRLDLVIGGVSFGLGLD